MQRNAAYGAGGGILVDRAGGPAGDIWRFVDVGDIDGHHLGGGVGGVLGIHRDAGSRLRS